MSRLQPERRAAARVVLGVDGDTVAWHEAATACRGWRALAWREAAAGLPAPAGSVVDVVASFSAAVYWLQPVPAGLASLAELRLLAGARCAMLFGGRPDDWWVAGDWRTHGHIACTALPRTLVTPIAQALRAARCRQRWHAAWSLLLDAGALPGQGWQALRSPQRLLLWYVGPEGVQALSAQAAHPRQPAAAAVQQAQAQRRLEARRHGLRAAGPLDWLDLRAKLHDTGADTLTASAELRPLPTLWSGSASIGATHGGLPPTPADDTEAALAAALFHRVRGLA